MAVQFEGGVVIGADSRTTSGSYIVRSIFLHLSLNLIIPCRPTVSQINWHSSMIVYTAVGRVLQQTHKPSQISGTIISRCKRTLLAVSFICMIKCNSSQTMGTPPTVLTAAAIMEKMCYQNKDQLSAGIIVAGWDKNHGPGVYNIPLGGGLFRQPWAIGGLSYRHVYILRL